MSFNAYRSNPGYPPRSPDLSNQRYADETDLISSTDGLGSISSAPASAIEPASPPGGDPACKYLWVVTPSDVPIALENGPAAAKMQRKRLSHTNLTGGAQAHAGGELWFTAADVIVINGGSSRYKPRPPDEVEAVALALAGLGYTVGHLPYDPGVNRWARNPKQGTIKWQSATR